MTGNRVVILAHATDRTGPPMYLLSLLRHLDRSGLDLVVVALRGGELLEEMQKFAEVRVIGEPVDASVASPTRLAEEPARLRARRAQLADLTGLDLVVVNTAWSIHALAWLPPGPYRTLSFVHELSAGVGDLLAPTELERLLASDHFVAGCRAVVDMLGRTHGVSPDLIDLIPYGVDIETAPDPADQTVIDRTALQCDPTSFLVVAAAVPDRRKSPDLYVHLAGTARRRRPDIDWAFRWIGAEESDDRLRDARDDRTLLGADDLLRFIPSTPQLRAHLEQADAFVLPSREDAFPLAAVEAALAGLPLLCFDTGGITDLIGSDGGVVVPFPDLAAMVDTLACWHDEPLLLRATGTAARTRALRNHDARDHARTFGVLLRKELKRGAEER